MIRVDEKKKERISFSKENEYNIQELRNILDALEGEHRMKWIQTKRRKILDIVLIIELKNYQLSLKTSHHIWHFKFQDILNAELFTDKQQFSLHLCPMKNPYKDRKRYLKTFLLQKQDRIKLIWWKHGIDYLSFHEKKPYPCDIPNQTENIIIKSFSSQFIRKSCLVLINPVSGSGKGLKTFQKQVEPLLKASGIHYHVQPTNYQYHSHEILTEPSDLCQMYCKILIIGGDGFFAEVIQGLMKRNDWKKAIKIPLGIIPCGSGNGLSKSIASSCQEILCPLNATFISLKGWVHPLDIATTRNERELFYSSLSLEWAYIANVDLESERFRFVGGLRFTFSALIKLCCNRQQWYGKLFYLPENKHQENEDDYNKATVECKHLFPLNETVPKNWKCIEGEFSLFWSMNVPFAATDAKIAPMASMNDGYIYIIFIIGKISKIEMLKILLAFEKGDHIQHDLVQCIKTKAFYLLPNSTSDLMAVDGEPFGCLPTQVEVHRGLACVLSLTEHKKKEAYIDISNFTP